MKVGSATSAAPVAGARPQARGASDGFALAGADDVAASAPAARAGALGAVSSLGALLALQETPGPLERRLRAVKRAGVILDALDDLKIVLLDDGAVDASALERLGQAVREARDQTDDPGLEDVLEQIEVRAAVELAKRQRLAHQG